MARTVNLFISHSWAYTDAYQKFCALLDKRPHFSYKNYSVPKNDPVHNADNEEELYGAILKQISPCHVVVVMAGKYSTFSKWIGKEIQIAKREFNISKPILGVKPWANTQVSTVVQSNADALVGWNSNSIVDAIRELAF